MLHDIVEFNAYKDKGGGVPYFWTLLVRLAGRHRTVEFVQQAGVFPTNMGLGLLLPRPPPAPHVSLAAWGGSAEVEGIADAQPLSFKQLWKRRVFGTPQSHGRDSMRNGRAYRMRLPREREDS